MNKNLNDSMNSLTPEKREWVQKRAKEINKAWIDKFGHRDPERIDRILEKIRKIWKKDPDLRLAQLVLNCYTGGEPNPAHGMEDDILEKRLEEVYKGLI